MRKLSRWMPEAPPERIVPKQVSVLLVLAIVLICLALSLPAFILVTGFILLVVLATIYDRRRFRLLAEQRVGESICTFARSFDRHAVDPWIIRGVYEEFQKYFDGGLPVRAVDSIEKDLRMDWEDVDDLVTDAAWRAGRSMEHTESNPFYGQVRNVGDVVLFLTYQPMSDAQ